MRTELARDRAAWWAVAAVLGLVLAATLVTFIGTFVTAVFLYYVSRPVYRRLRPRLGRTLAAAGSLIALAIPVVILLVYTLLIGLQELQALAQEIDLGPFQEAAEPYVDVSEIVQDPASLLEDPDVVAAGTLVAEGLVQYLPIVVVGLLHLFVALAATFYMLRDGPRLAGWVRRTFADEDATILIRYGRIVDEDLSSVFFGNILNAVITAGIGAITFNALNVIAPPGGAIPYPALLGLLAGAASLIPVVGMKLVYIPVAALLFGQAFLEGRPLWFPATFFVVAFVIVDSIPDLVLRPYVSGRHLHVGLVMIAYIVGPLLFGWYGLFLGPLLLVLVVHFGQVVMPELLVRAPRPTGTGGVRDSETTRSTSNDRATDPARVSGRRCGIDPLGALVGDPLEGIATRPPGAEWVTETESRPDEDPNPSDDDPNTSDEDPNTPDENSKPPDDHRAG